jgi:hypothetical protein
MKKNKNCTIPLALTLEYRQDAETQWFSLRLPYFARVKKDLREAPLTQFFISGSSCNFVPPFTKNKKRYALPIYLRICI